MGQLSCQHACLSICLSIEQAVALMMFASELLISVSGTVVNDLKRYRSRLHL